MNPPSVAEPGHILLSAEETVTGAAIWANESHFVVVCGRDTNMTLGFSNSYGTSWTCTNCGKQYEISGIETSLVGVNSDYAIDYISAWTGIPKEHLIIEPIEGAS